MYLLKTPEKTASSAAFITAAGAIACGVCCVLPLAVPAVALACAGSMIAWFGGVQRWATALGILVVASAWVWIWRQSIRSRAKPARSTLSMMGMATAVLTPP
jgi:hypothetical protein